MKVLGIIGGIIAFFGVIFLLQWGGIIATGFFNAERETQRTRVFEESQAYTQGMKNELSDLFLQYQSATTSGRIGIAAVTRDKFAPVDTTDYPDHLQAFLRTIGAR
jgi:hypothetical protein